MKLSFSFRLTLYFSSLLVLGSGLAWKYLDAFVLVNGPFGPMKHPAGPWLLRAHAAGALACVFLLGMLAARHIPAGWRSRRKRGSGALMAGVAGVLVLSGYLLYYVGAEGARAWIAFGHFWLGILAVMPLGGHIVAKARR